MIKKLYITGKMRIDKMNIDGRWCNSKTNEKAPS